MYGTHENGKTSRIYFSHIKLHSKHQLLQLTELVSYFCIIKVYSTLDINRSRLRVMFE